jgi:hypothetical protein
MKKVREKRKHVYVENPEFRPLGRPMHMVCSNETVLREIQCSDMEMIYIQQE